MPGLCPATARHSPGASGDAKRRDQHRPGDRRGHGGGGYAGGRSGQSRARRGHRGWQWPAAGECERGPGGCHLRGNIAVTV